MDRFGNKQEVVDIHYKELVNFQAPTTKVESLRTLLNTVEKHLRSLKMLGESINLRIFVSMTRAKLPEKLLRQLEFNKGTKDDWDIDNLRHQLRDHIIACENSNKKREENCGSQRSFDGNSLTPKSYSGAYSGTHNTSIQRGNIQMIFTELKDILQRLC